MGFFNKILKGLGFEDEEEEIVKQPKAKKSKKNKKQSNVNATFNLNETSEIEKETTEEQIEEKILENTNQNDSLEFEVVKVKTQTDIQIVINKLKLGTKVLVNIENLSHEDIVRCLDFLTGAVYALNLKIQKIDEKIFLVK